MAAELETDITRQAEAERRFHQVRDEVVAAVRDGHIRCWARKAPGYLRPDVSAIHEELRGSLFLGPRTIHWDNWVHPDFRSPDVSASRVRGSPVYYDEVQFQAAEIYARWPKDRGNAMRSEVRQQSTGSLFPEAGDLVTPCELLTWIAFGTAQKKEDFLGGPVVWRPMLHRDVWASIYKEPDNLPRFCQALEARATYPLRSVDEDDGREVIGKYTPVEFCAAMQPHYVDGMVPIFHPKALRQRRAEASMRMRRVVSYPELAAAARWILDAQPEREARLAEATRLVLIALRDGKITAYELPANGVPRPIQATLFINPGITITLFDEIGPDEFHHGPSYGQVWFNGTDIGNSGLRPLDGHGPKANNVHRTDELADSPPETADTPQSTIAGERRARAYVEGLIRDGSSVPTTAWLVSELQRRFGVSERGARRAREAAITAMNATHWKQAAEIEAAYRYANLIAPPISHLQVLHLRPTAFRRDTTSNGTQMIASTEPAPAARGTRAKPDAQPHPTPDALTYTLAGAIAVSGLSRSRLYVLAATGEVLFRKVGFRTFVDGPSLRAYLTGLPAAAIAAPRKAAALP